jgi:hypothetical protein
MRKTHIRMAMLAGVAAIGIMTAPAASASTHQHAPGSPARQDVAAIGVKKAMNERLEFSNQWVNCSNGSVGYSGGQYYYEIACSLIDATSWTAILECTNGIYYYDGPWETFEDVQIYCPAGYQPEEAWVSWTT